MSGSVLATRCHEWIRRPSTAGLAVVSSNATDAVRKLQRPILLRRSTGGVLTRTIVGKEKARSGREHIMVHRAIPAAVLGSLVLVSGVIGCVKSVTPEDPPPGVPGNPASVGFDGYMVVHWRPPKHDQADVADYQVRYRRLKNWTGKAVEPWKHLATTDTMLQIDLDRGSYESQVQTRWTEGKPSAWWPDPPMRSFVD